MTRKEKQARKLERLKKQCPPKTYRLQDATVTKPDTDIFVPSRPVMYAKIEHDTLQNEQVKKEMKKLSTRKERRGYLNRVVRGAIDTIRTKMTEEMTKHQKSA